MPRNQFYLDEENDDAINDGLDNESDELEDEDSEEDEGADDDFGGDKEEEDDSI